MIVCCPSCSTRYRYASAVPDRRPLGRCSRCAEEFPLAAARRSYLISTPGGEASASLSNLGWGLKIGMDDPMLAGRVSPSALEGADGSQSVWSYRVLVGDDADPQRTGAEDVATAAAADHAAARSGEAAPRAAVPRSAPLLALFLACLGGAAGYYVWWFQVASWFPQASWAQHLDAMTLTASGVVTGLLLGWSWMRWAARKH